MLRSSHHLSEILRTRPEPIETESTVFSSRRQWSRKRALKTGRYHLIPSRFSQQASSQLSIGVTSNVATIQTSEKYSYDRRLTTIDQPRVIRLLNVFPGSGNDPIACELCYVPPEHPPHYQAISYCWEGQEPSVTISCNGQPLRITENLSAAITALRREDKKLLLWADAICIDQASVEEKNSQVPLMRSIFQNAAIVHAWLGDDTPSHGGREAFNLLQELYHAYSLLSWDFNIFVKQSPSESLDSCKLPALRDPSWISVMELIQRPWFARAWIVQEVAVSQRAQLHCGEVSLDWNEFCFGCLFAIKAGLLTIRIDAFQHSLRLAQLASLITTYVCFRDPVYQTFDLSSLLQSHRFVEATDAKDKIYALLGLSTNIESHAHGIVPDYNLSTAQIYTDVSRAIITKSSTLDILGVPRTASNPLVGRIPSWVTDWSLPHLANALSCRNLQGDYIFDFKASDDHDAKKVTFRGSSLILNGHVFDTIVRVGKVMDPFVSTVPVELTRSDTLKTNPSIFSRMIHIYIVMQDWRVLVKSSCPTGSYQSTSDTLAEVFCRILLLDHLQEDYTIAAAVKEYHRFSLRVLYHVTSHLSRYPAIVRFLRWCEPRLFSGHALLQASKNSAPTRTTNTLAGLARRRMVVTSGGFLGLAPALAELGDCVAIVKGANVPLLLRPVENAKWKLMG